MRRGSSLREALYRCDGDGFIANSRVLGVFCSLHGARGANAYVTGAALLDVSDDSVWDFVDEDDLEESINYDSNGFASLELTKVQGRPMNRFENGVDLFVPSLTTKVEIEAIECQVFH